MPNITIRNLSKETHRAIQLRATNNGTSMETEIRKILNEAVTADTPVGLGSQLAALGRRFGGIEINVTRDKRPIEPANFD
jgi:plasmid stability protein